MNSTYSHPNHMWQILKLKFDPQTQILLSANQHIHAKVCIKCSSNLHMLTYTHITLGEAWPHPVSAGADRQAFAVCVKGSGPV